CHEGEASWRGRSTKTRSPKSIIKIEHATTSGGASAPLVVSAICPLRNIFRLLAQALQLVPTPSPD
ncbi:hypothetical protein, partial [Pseudomonas sp.]|uniref:hypothetical protein n=1 Tax=Pseudomonas sp. TaxID=306 RepID=UPI003D6ECCDD